MHGVDRVVSCVMQVTVFQPKGVENGCQFGGILGSVDVLVHIASISNPSEVINLGNVELERFQVLQVLTRVME